MDIPLERYTIPPHRYRHGWAQGFASGDFFEGGDYIFVVYSPVFLGFRKNFPVSQELLKKRDASIIAESECVRQLKNSCIWVESEDEENGFDEK